MDIAHTTVGGYVRYLFVTVDGGGNLYPGLALAGRLAGRGHDVRFLGNRSQRTVIERAGHGFAPYRWAPDIDATASETSRFKDWATDPGTAFAALCDHVWFGSASLFAADVTTELGRHRADALAIDYFLYGALAAAEKAAKPTAVLWHTTFGEWEVLNQGLPALNAARSRISLPPLTSVFEQYRRMDRVLVLTSELFDFAITSQPRPANVRHVGPQLPPGSGGPLAGHEPRQPLVVVSLSTTYQAQQDVLRRIIAALGTLAVRGLVTTGPAVRVEHLGLGRILPAHASTTDIADAVRGALADPALGNHARRHAASLQAEIAQDRAVTEMEALTSR